MLRWCRVSAALVSASAALLPSALSLAQGVKRVALAPSKPAVAPRVVSLRVEPPALQLNGSADRTRPLVMALMADGTARDVTRLARPTPRAGLVAVEPDGALRSVKDGEEMVTFAYGGKTTAARVRVKDAAKLAPVSFLRDVVPILTRNGCNQGACHGAQFGKGGFRLSLAGYDPDSDFIQITKSLRGRRITPADPPRSLLLTKPAMRVPHAGGLRLAASSSDYATLVRWLQDGTPGPRADEPALTKLEVFPSERVLKPGGPSQRLFVRAVYADGTSRDVTPHARLNTLNDAVASCTPEGVVSPVGRGQTSVMVRYSGLATIATVVVPYREAQTPVVQAIVPSGLKGGALVDALVEAKQKQLGLAPSPPCDDRAFIRRVTFDLIGVPPTPDEIRAFLADKSPDRRAKLIDALLERPEYAEYWGLKWGDLLRSNRTALGLKGMWSFTNWIRDGLRQNRPFDKFARDLILAQGSTFTVGPANYFRVASNPQDLAETTSQVFLGVRMQCARCHQHPFERWSQKDYYQFAAFFARVGIKGSQEFGLFGNEQVVRINDGGDVYHPKTGQRMMPTPLGVQLTLATDNKPADPDADGDRRRALTDWLTAKNNRLFARNIANRYWGYLFGRGIVNPIDDMRVTNPPSNPALLDALADIFVQSGYDVKHLLRTIASSKTYQRSSAATPDNKADETFFTHYVPRRLGAESLLEAIDAACGTREKYPELPLGTRAIAIPDPGVGSDFLDTFGRPMRLTACECERQAEPNLSQTLRLMNGDLMNRKVTQGDGRVAKLVSSGKPDADILEELYLVTLGRSPAPRERRQVLGLLALSTDRKAVFEDVLITLLNSKEFLFNR